jgi:CHAT domain-containing protein
VRATLHFPVKPRSLRLSGGGTFRGVESDLARRKRLGFRTWFLPVLLLLAAGGFGFASLLLPSSGEKTVRAELLSLMDVCRPIAGRLAGQKVWAVSRNSCSLTANSLLPLYERASTAGTSLARSLADRGVLHLLGGQIDNAISDLERAAALQPSNPEIANDLAAAYLARGDSGHAYSLVQALGLTFKALDLAPESREARFNHALALNRLSLVPSAMKGWKETLEAESDPEWRSEIQRKLRALDHPDPQARFQSKLSHLFQPAETDLEAAVGKLIMEFPQSARSSAQNELLGGWADAYLRDDASAAERNLRLARLVGGALAQRSGEMSVADSVTAIDRAYQSTGVLGLLARGHLRYSRGVELYESLEPAAAAMELFRAQDLLNEGASPAALWSSFRLIGTDYYLGGGKSAEKRIEILLRSPHLSRYPALEGRLLWASGLIRLRAMELLASLADFEKALALFEALGERENVGALEYLLAENQQLLGEVERAWDHRLRALSALSPFRSSIRLNNLLLEASKALVQEERLREALSFQDEQLEVARSIGRRNTLVESLIFRGRLRSLVGELERAAEDFTEAQDQANGLDDIAIRARLLAESAVAQSQILLAKDPSAVVSPISEAIEFFEANHLLHNAVRAYFLRAQARLALADIPGADRDFTRGIEAHEAARSRLRGVPSFFTYLDRLDTPFDDVIRLHVEAGQWGRAWEFLERAKTDRGLGATGRIPALDDLCRRLRPNVVIFEYAVLPDRLLLWVLRRERVEFRSQPLARADLKALAESFVFAIRRDPAGDSYRKPAERLYDLLIGSASDLLNSGDRLVIVPDGPLVGVPFAALIDPNTGRFLLEDRVLSHAPSAAIYINAAEHGRAGLSPNPPALLVGNPAPARLPSGQLLESLRGASGEIERLSGLYHESRVLYGSEATREELVSQLDSVEVFHFAGHAQGSSRRPGEAFVVLAENDAGGPGILSAAEVLGLTFKNLRLVVFSSCESGVGGNTRDAGGAGLAASFVMRGVPAGVGALWKVQDNFSHQLLSVFHRNLAIGIPAAAALQEAQVACLTGMHRRHPSFWAAYQLVGELGVEGGGRSVREHLGRD